jgi:hypothetical protein
VIEPMPGDWQIVQESHAHKKEIAHTRSGMCRLPAEGKTTLTWRVRRRKFARKFVAIKCSGSTKVLPDRRRKQCWKNSKPALRSQSKPVSRPVRR